MAFNRQQGIWEKVREIMIRMITIEKILAELPELTAETFMAFLNMRNPKWDRQIWAKLEELCNLLRETRAAIDELKRRLSLQEQLEAALKSFGSKDDPKAGQ